jgi:hypothetical protein
MAGGGGRGDEQQGNEVLGAHRTEDAGRFEVFTALPKKLATG